MAWNYLVVAGLFEVAWAIGLKYTEGWPRLWPSLGTLAGMVVSFRFLSQALKAIPLGTGCALRTGNGAMGGGTVGTVLVHAHDSTARLAVLSTDGGGVVGSQ